MYFCKRSTTAVFLSCISGGENICIHALQGSHLPEADLLCTHFSEALHMVSSLSMTCYKRTCRGVHLLSTAVQIPHTQGFQIYCNPIRVTGLAVSVNSSTSEKNPQISPRNVSRKKQRSCLRKPRDVTVVASQN